ncbi:hypothetical protein DFQ28_008379 [Apophysomyces sp. BC1034]|nr:hypothetical protein DFQ30_008095 [Apophysomyces sp. BC1015]KAG0178468.1 hypothetical protein DFQ29_003445 [Apophysomyces sp. BC1021]KAG0186047.1 hypothetical protein DFQ28_008379 [Apophysomyces sp. BC1034]
MSLESVFQFVEKRSDRAKLTLTAVAAAALTASALLTFQAVQRRRRANSNDEDITVYKQHWTPPTTSIHHDQSLIDEQLARNIAFLGKEGVDKVRGSFVVVVGAGSVGSWAALMLLRAGVGKIRIIDPASIGPKSMMVHATARADDLGLSKAFVLEKHFKEIAPFVQIESRIELLTVHNREELLAGNPDYVVDAIDSMNAKIELIQYCYANQLKVISHVYPGAKADPTRIQVADISDTMDDPMARAFRRKLKKMHIDRNVPLAFSIEKPKKFDLRSQEDINQLPVMGPIPAMFGMAIATHILLDIADFPALDAPSLKPRDGTYARIHRELVARENNVYGASTCALDLADVGYIFEEIWSGKSILSGPQDRVALARWDRSKPLSYLNTVCMSKDEARAHDALPASVDLRQQYGDDVVEFVHRQFELEKRMQNL